MKESTDDGSSTNPFIFDSFKRTVTVKHYRRYVSRLFVSKVTNIIFLGCELVYNSVYKWILSKEIGKDIKYVYVLLQHTCQILYCFLEAHAHAHSGVLLNAEVERSTCVYCIPVRVDVLEL